MTQGLGFEYATRGDREVVIRRDGRVVTVLRGPAARKLLMRIVDGDPQQVMARATGNYKRGNER